MSADDEVPAAESVQDSASPDSDVHDAAAHDPAGGELARAVARAYRGLSRPASAGGSGGAGGAGPRGRRRRGQAWGGGPGPQVSGAHPDDRDPQPVEATLGRLVAEHGWSTEIAVHGVFGRWDEIVGAQVASHCRPERFVDGRLSVRADSSAWATQVRLLTPMVLQRLADELGEGTVVRIDVRGPDAPSWKHGRLAVRDGRGPRDTYG